MPSPFEFPSTLRVGQWVEYHGSLSEYHGRSYQIAEIHAGRPVLRSTSGEGLARVSPSSVTVIEA